MEWTDRGTQLFACAVSMTIISTIFVTLRFISRGCVLHVLGPTDWFMAVTLLLSITNAICIGFQVANGLGHPIALLSLDEQKTFLKLLFAGLLIANTSLVLTKISILSLLVDIFVMSTMRKAAFAVIIAVTVYGLWLTFSNIFFCIPVHSFWDPTIPNRRCINGPVKWYTDAGLNLALDLVIFFLPLPIVKSLTLPLRQKLWLYFVLALGFFVCIMSALRVYFLWVTITRRSPWAAIEIATWSTIDINVSIAIACIITLKPLVAKLCPRLLTSDETLNVYDLPRPPTISSAPCRLRGFATD
ncbi:hypothetical protein MFIFM68171_06586 [Madurella fahalii]|uniref:Rhodopsin domain-containing protein n=1 Tax=Madurella fahalii TaxID=1157608 RepID=A0ABQ0GF46_9PEZI